MPLPLAGVDPSGRPTSIDLARRTVVLALKPDCDGCQEFLAGPVAFDGCDVVLVAATPMTSAGSPWTSVVVAPAWMAQAGIVAAPSYTVIDPSTGRVVTEGVALAPSQVATEIAPYLE
ncbi:MAG: hypothetical protein KGJ92_03100 [Actinomycetales bacterium]|nr:hypothetical protein [Actinomycetales bacterium]